MYMFGCVCVSVAAWLLHGHNSKSNARQQIHLYLTPVGCDGALAAGLWLLCGCGCGNRQQLIDVSAQNLIYFY